MQSLLSNFIARIEEFMEECDGLSLLDLIDEKLKYNATRGMKHGGNEV
jgi:hypothetical protein